MASPSAPTSAAELKKALLADPKASTNEGQAKAKTKAKDKKKVNPVAKQMLERRQKKIKAQEAMKGVAVPKPAVVDEAKVEEAQAQLLRMLEEEEVRRQAREEKRRDRRKKGKERKKGAGQAQEDEDLKEEADDQFDPQEAQKLEKIIPGGGCITEAVGAGDSRKGDEQPINNINNMQARALAGALNEEDMVNNGGAEDQRAQSEEEEAGVAEGEDGYEDAEEGEEAGVAWIVIHPDFLMCPISMALMTDPVLAADGFTYQREAIEAWIHKCKNEKKAVRSPSTNEPLGSLDLHANLAFRSIVYAHLNARRNNLPVVT